MVAGHLDTTNSLAGQTHLELGVERRIGDRLESASYNKKVFHHARTCAVAEVRGRFCKYLPPFYFEELLFGSKFFFCLHFASSPSQSLLVEIGLSTSPF